MHTYFDYLIVTAIFGFIIILIFLIRFLFRRQIDNVFDVAVEYHMKKQIEFKIKKIRKLKFFPILTENGDLITSFDELFNHKYIKNRNKSLNFYMNLYNFIDYRDFLYNSGEIFFNIELINNNPDENISLTRFFNPIFKANEKKYIAYLRREKFKKIIL